jgi:hypothetical protein
MSKHKPDADAADNAERKARTTSPEVAAMREWLQASRKVRQLTARFESLGRQTQVVKEQLDAEVKRRSAAKAKLELDGA